MATEIGRALSNRQYDKFYQLLDREESLPEELCRGDWHALHMARFKELNCFDIEGALLIFFRELMAQIVVSDAYNCVSSAYFFGITDTKVANVFTRALLDLDPTSRIRDIVTQDRAREPKDFPRGAPEFLIKRREALLESVCPFSLTLQWQFSAKTTGGQARIRAAGLAPDDMAFERAWQCRCAAVSLWKSIANKN